MVLGSARPLIEMSASGISWGVGTNAADITTFMSAEFIQILGALRGSPGLY